MIDLLEDVIDPNEFQELVPEYTRQLSEKIAPLFFESALPSSNRQSLFRNLMTHTTQLIREHGLPDIEPVSEGSALGSEDREAGYEELLKQKIEDFMRMIDQLYR
jgi:hypothetical protein